jgi:hypothetical protein
VQPTMHLERKAEYGRGKYPTLRSRCVVGCIFGSVGLIITHEPPCASVNLLKKEKKISKFYVQDHDKVIRKKYNR